MINAIAMTALLAAAFGTFAWTATRRLRLLTSGMPDNRFDRMIDRMASAPDGREPDLAGYAIVFGMFVLPILGAGLALAGIFSHTDETTRAIVNFNAVGALATGGGLALLWSMKAQIKMPKYATAGIAHYMIFGGFAVLLLRTIILTGRGFDPHFNLWLLDPKGPLPWGLMGKGYNVMKDFVVLGVVAGVSAFVGFRLVNKTKRLAYGWHAWAVLGVIATMMLADMLHDVASIARDAVKLQAVEGKSASELVNKLAWDEGSPVGWLGAKVLLGIGLGNETLLSFLSGLGYWTHVALVWGFLNYLPYGKHFHVITALPNVLFREMGPPGRLRPMAKTSEELMEKIGAAAELTNPTDEPIGVARIEHFSWKSVLDFYTCTECGRCSDNCPAHRTGKMLSPKHLTLDLRNHLYARNEEFLNRDASKNDDTVHNGLKRVDLVPDVIDPDVLWGCTTCRACEEQCPVMITYVDKIVDMRRNLVMVRGEIPHELQRISSALETNGNPWNITRMDRGNWADGLDIPLLRDKPDAEVLFWVGCAGAYDDKAKKIATATAKIMKAAGVDFAILGDEETCTGDPARRAGIEYLYMMLGEQNVATLNQYKFRKIVATCPHCFNTLLNEYPDLGGHYKVVHHSEFLLDLVLSGKITPRRAVRGKVVFHDSCYLGRHNGVYDSPRELLKRIPGLELVEAEWSREKGLCCGAGGAQMWMEEQNNDRVNRKRTLQLLGTGAKTIASGCPFCHTMLADGLGSFEDTEHLKHPVEQLDLSVLLERSLALPAATARTEASEATEEASA